MIYFIAGEFNGQTMYKIGFTKGSAKVRLKQLQTACPVPLKVIKEFPGDLSDEKKVHGYLNCLRVEGEWFTYGPLMEQFLSIPPGNPMFNHSTWVVENGKYLRKWKTETGLR